MTLNMLVKKARIEDLESLTELFDQYRYFYKHDSDKVAAREFLTARINNKESEILAVFDEKGIMAGFVQLYPIFSSTRMKKLWLLNDLYVLPNYRGKGLSLMLIEESKQICRKTGACGIILETAKTNMIGNRLYPRTGFSLDKDHNYYSWDV